MSGADSPCIQVCTMDAATGLCLGCHRSLQEIAVWAQLSPRARRAIMERLPARAAQGRAQGSG